MNEEAEARVLAAAQVLSLHLPDIKNRPGVWGSRLESLMHARVNEIIRNEPSQLSPSQLVELYALELIEAVKSHRRATGIL